MFFDNLHTYIIELNTTEIW